ncbi:hypothetical protein [Stieleria varia]|nr:hypothetical protein [Stieleria varia]
MATGSSGFLTPFPLAAAEPGKAITPTPVEYRVDDPSQWCGWIMEEAIPSDTCNYDTWSQYEDELVAKAKRTDRSEKQIDKQITEQDSEALADAEAVTECSEEHFAEYLGPATHDSLPQPALSTQPTISRTSSQFDSSIAAVAATACASAGIPFEQMVEPFAMVGTRFGGSGDQIDRFQQWWIEAAEKHAAAQAAEQIAALAADVTAESDDSEQSVTDESFLDEGDADSASSAIAQKSDAENEEVSNMVPVVDFDSEIAGDELWANESEAEVAQETAEVVEEITEVDEALIAAQDEVEIKAELDRLAGEEPVDADEKLDRTLGKSVLAMDSIPAEPEETTESVITESLSAEVQSESSSETSPETSPETSTGSVATAENAEVSEPTAEASVARAAISEGQQVDEILIGSSPVICTIPEAYLPYDLAARDLPHNGLFSFSKQPFCVLTQDLIADVKQEPAQSGDWSPLDPNAVPVAELTEEIGAEDVRYLEHLLDEVVSNASEVITENDLAGKRLSADQIGQDFAALVVSGEGLVQNVARQLALVWPAQPQQVGNAGAELLARAQAVEQIEPVQSDQLAEATATVLQWVDAAQRVADSVGQRWQEITEVARNRGTQSQPTRR